MKFAPNFFRNFFELMFCLMERSCKRFIYIGNCFLIKFFKELKELQDQRHSLNSNNHAIVQDPCHSSRPMSQSKTHLTVLYTHVTVQVPRPMSQSKTNFTVQYPCHSSRPMSQYNTHVTVQDPCHSTRPISQSKTHVTV